MLNIRFISIMSSMHCQALYLTVYVYYVSVRHRKELLIHVKDSFKVCWSFHEKNPHAVHMTAHC